MIFKRKTSLEFFPFLELIFIYTKWITLLSCKLPTFNQDVLLFCSCKGSLLFIRILAQYNVPCYMVACIWALWAS